MPLLTSVVPLSHLHCIRYSGLSVYHNRPSNQPFPFLLHHFLPLCSNCNVLPLHFEQAAGIHPRVEQIPLNMKLPISVSENHPQSIRNSTHMYMYLVELDFKFTRTQTANKAKSSIHIQVNIKIFLSS